MEENISKIDPLKTKYPLPLFLYDGQCGMCLRFKQSLERIPGSDEFTMVSIHEQEIYQAYPEVSFEEANKEVHVIDEAGNIFKGADAVSFIISKFPLAKKFAWLLESDMGKKALQFFHDKADQFRETLLKQCKNCK